MGAIKAQGSKIEIGDGAETEVFTEIEGVFSIDITQDEASDIETTNLASSSKEFIIGLPGASAINIGMNEDDTGTQQNVLRGYVGDQSLNNYRVTLVNGRTFDVPAYAKNYSVNVGLDDAVKASVSLRGSEAATVAG